MRELFEKTLSASSYLHSGHVFWHEECQQYQASDDEYVEEAEGMNWSLATFTKCRIDYEHLLAKYRATKQLQYNTSEHNSRLFSALLLVKDHFDMNGLDKSMPRVYEEIKETLEDKRRNKHNTSCTYQWELAFLNLQDTPELRKLYWSALGKIEFDRNDQIIPPVLEDCPYCKGNQE